jgi:hypothetical protein
VCKIGLSKMVLDVVRGCKTYACSNWIAKLWRKVMEHRSLVFTRAPRGLHGQHDTVFSTALLREINDLNDPAFA